MRQMWKAAGGDEAILRQSTFSDQVKYMCLGGIIVATGLMAALAGGYAFYTVFSPRGSALVNDEIDMATLAISIGFGLFWGLMIFNLDRFIVSSTGTGDGTEAITRSEFTSAIPRIILGAIIAITISKPVEIRMFKTEIDVALYKEQQEQKQDHIADANTRYLPAIQAEEEKIVTYRERIDAAVARSSQLEDQYIEEARNIRPGPRAAAVKVQLDAAVNEAERITEKTEALISNSQKRIDQIEAERQNAIDQGDDVAASLDGLLERIKLAHKIAGWEITLFVTLLFLAIELTPIFFKLMLIKSPYDYMKENIEEQIKAEKGIVTYREYHTDGDGRELDMVKFLQRDKVTVEQQKLQEAQEEIIQYAIDKYVERMREKIDADPTVFVQSTTETSEDELG